MRGTFAASKAPKTPCPPPGPYATLRVPSLWHCSGGKPRRAIHGPARLARLPAEHPPEQHLRSAFWAGPRSRLEDLFMAREKAEASNACAWELCNELKPQ